MAIQIEFADDVELQARIKVIGVGGGGGNAINTMIASGLEGVEFIATNTDAQALQQNLAPTKIQLGCALTKGLGAGGTPDVGRKSALEDVQRIAEAIDGADMVFITAGMGGGTGTGAAPVIAQVVRDQGALTVGVVTRPFGFEGRRRARNGDQGVDDLAESVDTIITIPNQKLLELDDDLSMLDAFQRADDVLLQAVRGISDLIVNAGMINVDFADVKTIMSNQGPALMGTGYGRGERRAIDAAEMAINSPLLDDVSVHGATGILLNFTAGPDIRLKEINEAASHVQESAHEEANIIFGVVTDPDMSDVVKVTVIATGFEAADEALEGPAEQTGPRLRERPASRVAVLDRGAHLGAGRPPTTARSGIGGYRADGVVARGAAASAAAVHRPTPAEPPRAAVRDASPRLRRAFGAAALHDEAVLEVPAFLRRTPRD
ncbi:MAG TPA: cell division protein FtsZ [Polyangiaceae bacterium LLY-WYZ-14_1]|nr:cell division protein FtsZ [Polyangiaceae bacterium LLY-WYZ-14_1]